MGEAAKAITEIYDASNSSCHKQDQIRHKIHLAQKGDDIAKSNLVEDNMPLVYSVAKRFYASGREVDDLVQLGSIGLLKAIDRFNFDYDVAFSTYAVPMIMGEIRRFIRDDSPINISRSIKERGVLLKHTKEEIIKKTGQEPTIHQLASESGLKKEEVVTALEAMRPMISINERRYNDDSDGDLVLEHIEAKGKNSEQDMLDNINIHSMLDVLPDRLQKIIYMRFFQDKTQTEVARELDISQVQVCRLEKKAYMVLRDCLKGS